VNKFDLLVKGLIPFGFGAIFMLFGMFFGMIFSNTSVLNAIFNVISLGFILLWGYIGYDMGKDEGVLIKKLLLVHLFPFLIVALQILVMVRDSLTTQSSQLLVAQFFYIPVLNLLNNLFHISMETGVIWSFVVMIIAFFIGMAKGEKAW